MRRRLIRLVVLAVVVPVAAEAAVRGADALEQRRGPTPVSKGLRASGTTLRRLRR